MNLFLSHWNGDIVGSVGSDLRTINAVSLNAESAAQSQSQKSQPGWDRHTLDGWQRANIETPGDGGAARAKKKTSVSKIAMGVPILENDRIRQHCRELYSGWSPVFLVFLLLPERPSLILGSVRGQCWCCIVYIYFRYPLSLLTIHHGPIAVAYLSEVFVWYIITGYCARYITPSLSLLYDHMIGTRHLGGNNVHPNFSFRFSAFLP